MLGARDIIKLGTWHPVPGTRHLVLIAKRPPLSEWSFFYEMLGRLGFALRKNLVHAGTTGRAFALHSRASTAALRRHFYLFGVLHRLLGFALNAIADYLFCHRNKRLVNIDEILAFFA